MAIYVEQSIWPYRGTMYCHMATDGDIEELHQFAKSIGLKRSWFQKHRVVDHYDISPSKRSIAISKGAIEVDAHEILELCINSKEKR